MCFNSFDQYAFQESPIIPWPYLNIYIEEWRDALGCTRSVSSTAGRFSMLTLNSFELV